MIKRLPFDMPPEDKHILVRSKAFLFDFKTKHTYEVEPIWREAYFIRGNWGFWCGRHGTTSTDPCLFTEWVDLPQG